MIFSAPAFAMGNDSKSFKHVFSGQHTVAARRFVYRGIFGLFPAYYASASRRVFAMVSIQFLFYSDHANIAFASHAA